MELITRLGKCARFLDQNKDLLLSAVDDRDRAMLWMEQLCTERPNCPTENDINYILGVFRTALIDMDSDRVKRMICGAVNIAADRYSKLLDSDLFYYPDEIIRYAREMVFWVSIARELIAVSDGKRPFPPPQQAFTIQ